MSEEKSQARLQYACPRCRRPFSLPENSTGWHCPACNFGMRRLAGVPSFVAGDSDEWQDFFETKAAGSEGDTLAAMEYQTSLLHRYLIRAFGTLSGDLPRGGAVLDAGCGNGLFWKAFMGPRPAVGVDFSPTMCRLARAKGMAAHHADVRALPFADEQFDLVYCVSVAQYVEDLHALLGEFTRVCRTGGLVIVSMVNRSSFLRRLLHAIRSCLPRKDMPQSFPYHLRRPDELVAAAEGLPLSMDKVAWLHFPLPCILYTRKATYPLHPLAADFVVRFVKTAAAS